jgi:hypothetical protein
MLTNAAILKENSNVPSNKRHHQPQALEPIAEPLEVMPDPVPTTSERCRTWPRREYTLLAWEYETARRRHRERLSRDAAPRRAPLDSGRRAAIFPGPLSNHTIQDPPVSLRLRRTDPKDSLK